MSHIARQFATIPIHFVANTCETEAIDVGHFAGGIVQIGAAWTTAHIGVKVSEAPTNTFVPLYDRNDAILKITHPRINYAYPLPDEVYGAHYIRLWSVSNSTTDFNQAAARTLVLNLKG